MTKTRQPDPEFRVGTKTVVLTFRVPQALADEVRAIAAAKDEPLSDALRRSLANYARNHRRVLRGRESGRGAAS